MSSFKQLMKEGVLKRADAHKVRFCDIVVEDGFNKRDHREELTQHIQAMVEFIKQGGKLPPLEVKPLDDNKVLVVDGHCRREAYAIAIELGHYPMAADGEWWIAVEPFNGDDAERTARIATSNSQLELTPLERARVYQSLRDEHGKGPEDIAKLVNKTRQHVDQLLILADAPEQVKQMVAAGTVSATEAMKVTRTHGANAADVLGKAANDNAGKKVTAKALKPWTPPAKVVVPVVEALDEFMETLTASEREVLAELERGTASTGTMMVSGTKLLKLLQAHGALLDAREAAEAKARERANAAAQTNMPLGDAA